MALCYLKINMSKIVCEFVNGLLGNINDFTNGNLHGLRVINLNEEAAIFTVSLVNGM